MNKFFIFILPFLLLSFEVLGQGWLTEENNIETNWNVTFQLGSNLLLTEFNKDFSGSDNNMSSRPGLGANIQLSKMIWERIDMGTEFGYTFYNGINENPSSINYLMLSEKFNNSVYQFLPYPVIYHSEIFNLAVYTKYNFINFRTYPRSYIKINLFLRFGIGMIYLSSKLGYKEMINYQLSGLADPLFSSHNELSFLESLHAYISPAVGINYQISDRIFVSAEVSFQFYNTGLVDGVYNISDKLSSEIINPDLEQFEIPVFDLSGKLMFGCTYFFNLDTHRKTRTNALPWYYNRYRSYYSKYHTPASKRKIKERLPFYNNKIDD